MVTPPRHPTRRPAPPAAPEPERALVIEADPARRRWLVTLLRDEGYEVTAVDSVFGTHAMVRLLAPAIVVLDLALPYRSGLSLLPQLKLDPQTARIPVVVLTAEPHELLPPWWELATTVVPKPWHEVVLRAALHTARGATGSGSAMAGAAGAPAPPTQPPPDVPSPAPQVLVVDDDLRFTTFLATLIQDEGYTVETARDGATALDLLATRYSDIPAVILLDMKMPVMDGWEFTRRYRATPPPHAPLICLTGVHAVREQSQAIGAEGYLGKPFTLQALRTLLERHAKRIA